MHYNPFGWSHACYPYGRHVGDIGNIVVASDGTYNVEGLAIDLITLFGTESCLGRMFLIHELADDCSTNGPCGNCGGRHAQGVIGRMNDLLPVSNTGALVGITAGLRGTSESFGGIHGSVFARYTGTNSTNSASIEVLASLTGLPPSQTFSLSVYQYGDVTQPSSAGLGSSLTGGSLGSITSAADGTAYINIFVPVAMNLQDLIGRSIVLGDAKIASGAIGMAYTFPPYLSAAPGQAVLSFLSLAVTVVAFLL